MLVRDSVAAHRGKRGQGGAGRAVARACPCDTCGIGHGTHGTRRDSCHV